jgi:hypothetical protein
VTLPISINAKTAGRSRGLDMLGTQNSINAYGYTDKIANAIKELVVRYMT